MQGERSCPQLGPTAPSHCVPKAASSPTGQGWAARLEVWDLLAKRVAEVLGVPAGSPRGRRKCIGEKKREGVPLLLSLCSLGPAALLLGSHPKREKLSLALQPQIRDF